MCKLLEITARAQGSAPCSPQVSDLMVTIAFSVKEKMLQSSNVPKPCGAELSFPDLVTAQAKFILTTAVYLKESTDDRLKATSVTTFCLMHRDSYVREWAMKELNSGALFECSREAVLPIIVKQFWNEKDEDVLMQVC